MAERYGDWADWLLCLGVAVLLGARLSMRNPEGYSPRWWRQHPEVRPPSGVGSSENTKLDKLERSTVETYVSLEVAIVTVVFPVTWYIRVLLLCLLACIVGDLTWRSPWTVELSERLKMVICGI